MVNKLGLLFKNKLAVAILGAVVVASVGSAAAMAATGTSVQLPLLSQNQSSQHQAGDGSHGKSASQGDDHDGESNDDHEAEGTIKSIDSGHSSFVVTTEHGATVTVVVNGQTAFVGSAHSFSDLKVGMSVEVKGTAQSDGTLVASGVYVEDAHADDDSSGHATSTPGDDSHTGSGDSDTHTATPSTDH